MNGHAEDPPLSVNGRADRAADNTYAPSFQLRNRLERALFWCIWMLAAAWTPPPLHRWRCLVLRAFGAKVGRGVRIYGSSRVWRPANLQLGDFATIGPRARLYDQGAITIGPHATVSQGAHLCASTHRIDRRDFALVLRPIEVGAHAWVATEAFVGPGVRIGEGAVLGARAAAFEDLGPWQVYRGNPAAVVKSRRFA